MVVRRAHCYQSVLEKKILSRKDDVKLQLTRSPGDRIEYSRDGNHGEEDDADDDDNGWW